MHNNHIFKKLVYGKTMENCEYITHNCKYVSACMNFQLDS